MGTLARPTFHEATQKIGGKSCSQRYTTPCPRIVLHLSGPKPILKLDKALRLTYVVQPYLPRMSTSCLLNCPRV